MRPYGSNFPVRDCVGFFDTAGPPSNMALRPSFARGGLSNGWGSSVAPYRSEDLGAWPAATRNLAAHYEAVSRFMPISASRDGLEDVFPMWRVNEAHAFRAEPQGGELLARLSGRKAALARTGVVAGRARLAFRGEDCLACGLCLVGCPYGLIFSAASALNALAEDKNFTYESGLRAVRFESRDQSAALVVENIKSGERSTIEGDRLFIGAGVLSTARIVLNSMPDTIRALTLRDSQHLLMPMLHQWAPPRDLAFGPRNTLAQAFVEMNDPAISPMTIHTQIYGYNDFLKPDLVSKFGALSGILAPAIDFVSRRLLVAQMFAHSDHCGEIELRLNGAPGDARLDFDAREGASTRAVLMKAAGKLARTLSPSGVIALPFQARTGAVGSSFHVGASLPMSQTPGCGQTDIHGRIFGANRVHVIDASVFPSVPATTITFSVMANAHRIATDAPL
ncbi:MAG: GMC oxidoreductase [Parvularculaceae bacterium]